jgi:hypothetical protein
VPPAYVRLRSRGNQRFWEALRTPTTSSAVNLKAARRKDADRESDAEASLKREHDGPRQYRDAESRKYQLHD